MQRSKNQSQIKLLVISGTIIVLLIVNEITLLQAKNEIDDWSFFHLSSLLAIPLIITLLIKLHYLRKRFLSWNYFIEESNKKHIFNSTEEIDYYNSAEIKERFLSNLRKVTDFIQNISKGNYNIHWEGLNENNLDGNKATIASELIQMREQMKAVKEQDKVRNWSTEGLNKFGDLIRKHQHESNTLLDIIISKAVTYLDAKVGGLFIIEEKEGGQKHLSLKACYAYSRKKFIEKEVEIGNGILSECYLEGESKYLKQVPKNYISITSGLGEVTPRALLLVPLKTNDGIEGVMEMASLNEFKPYQIEFLEKLGESLAMSIRAIRVAEKTKSLLSMSQSQTEEMRAQEEEMRQNMEELEATQEQMNRQINELNLLKAELEKEKYLFAALMDNLPDLIYFKDRNCKLTRVSKHMAQEFGMRVDQIIGKSDFDFQDESHAREAYEDEQNIMRTRQPKIDFIEKEVRSDGAENWVSSTKMPLVNTHGEVVGTFGISKSITNYKILEEKLFAKELEYEKKIKLLQAELSRNLKSNVSPGEYQNVKL